LGQIGRKWPRIPAAATFCPVDRRAGKPYPESLRDVCTHQAGTQSATGRIRPAHGKDPAAALDDVLADYLEWEQQDYREAVEGIRRGYADYKEGRTQPTREVFEE
jgi:hypothetical protein